MKLNRGFKFLALSCSMLLLQSIAVIPTANADGQGALIKLAALETANTMNSRLIIEKAPHLIVASDDCEDMCYAQGIHCESKCGSNMQCYSGCQMIRSACLKSCYSRH